MPEDGERAVLLRQHLQTAQVKRADIFADDAQRKHVTFHDLRATGITWMAVAGEDPLRIKQRAGHRSFSTTEGYIREAENLRVGFGEPFPTLPPTLVQSNERSKLGALSANPSGFPEATWRREGDSNPWRACTLI